MPEAHYSKAYIDEIRSEMIERLQKLEKKVTMPRTRLRTPEEVLKRLKQNYESFSDKRTFTQLYDIPQKPGTYLIYKDSEVIYVGSSIHLRARLRQLLSGGGHVFHNKLRELFGSKEHVQSFLKTCCSLRYSLCKDKRQAELLEHFCINIHSPRYND